MKQAHSEQGAPNTPTKPEVSGPRRGSGVIRGVRGVQLKDGTIRRFVSRDVQIQRTSYIMGALNACLPIPEIITHCESTWGMSEKLIREWIGRIKGERSEQFAEDRPKYKAEQVTRLQGDLAKMRSMPNPPYAAISRHEELLVRIVGTAEPTKVETSVTVNVRSSLMSCIQHMDDGEIDDIAREQLELEATARSVRGLVGMGSLDLGVVEGVGVEVKTEPQSGTRSTN